MSAATAGRASRRAWLRRVFPGEPRVWWVAAVLGGLMLAGILLWSLLPRDFYTGTNSVRTRGMVAELPGGERLCVRGLQVPAETSRIQMEVESRGPRPALHARVLAGGRASVSRVPANAAGGHEKVAFPIPSTPRSPESLPGSICVQPQGQARVSFGGTLGVQSDDVLPTIGGREQEMRVAVWFLPPEGARKAPIALMPEVFRRAALFRPGVVGPWAYWLLLFVVVPGLIFWGLRLLAATSRSAGPQGRLMASLFLIAFLNAACWALITPSFNAPDESEHFAYAQYVAETGNAVDPAQGERSPYSSEQTRALEGVRLFSSTEQEDGKPPWLAADERRWEASLATSPASEEDGGGYAVATSSHTPLYYSLLAPAYLAVDSQSTFSQLALMRLVSALLGALVVLFAFLTVRELAPGWPVAAVAAALIVAFQPMFGFMSGVVNNDMGVNAGGAVVLFLLVRGLRRGLTPLTGAALGAAIAVTPLLKGTGLALYPAALLALLFMLWRHHRARDLAAYATVVVAFLVLTGGWDLLAPTFERSTLATPGGDTPAAGARADIAGYLSYLWQVFLPKLPFMTDLFVQGWPAFDIYVERGWGAFGWYALFFPVWVYVVVAVLMLGTGALAALALLRRRMVARRLAPELLVLVVAVAGVIAGVHAFYFSAQVRPVLPEFGRYAFPVIIALATVAVGSAFALPRRLLVPALAALVVLVMGMSYASRFLTLFGFYS